MSRREFIGAGVWFMLQKDPRVLDSSLDRQELVKTAILFARSPLPEDQKALLRALRSEDFLNRLDSEQEYELEPRMLRVARILKALMDNTSPAAHQTLIALTQSPAFAADEVRIELLIPALAVVRPAPPQAIQFWDKYSQADSAEVHLVIEALCDNGSEPAIALFEKKMLDPGFEREYLVAWMHDMVLRHRNDVPLLKCCQRLLTGGLPEEVRANLVESICDFSERWYSRDIKPEPPARAAASEEARDIQRAICRHALNHVTLNPVQKAAVERTLMELDILDHKK
jgi:hypothetical protein